MQLKNISYGKNSYFNNLSQILLIFNKICIFLNVARLKIIIYKKSSYFNNWIRKIMNFADFWQNNCVFVIIVKQSV